MSYLRGAFGVAIGLVVIALFIWMMIVLSASLAGLATHEGDRAWWFWPVRIVLGLVTFSLLATWFWGIVVGLFTMVVGAIAYGIGWAVRSIYRPQSISASTYSNTLGFVELGKGLFNILFWCGAGWFAILSPFLSFLPPILIGLSLGALLLVWVPSVMFLALIDRSHIRVHVTEEDDW